MTVPHSTCREGGRLKSLCCACESSLQVASSLIAALGFGGYTEPAVVWSVEDCQLCVNSQFNNVQFFSGIVPKAGTEGVYTSSVVGCTYYVIVAWIW